MTVKETLSKRKKAVPVPTDKPLSKRLLISLVWGLGTSTITAIMCTAFMNVLSDFGVVVGFQLWLLLLNLGCGLLAFVCVFILESEGNYVWIEEDEDVKSKD